jgi:enoyl-CoA hydratase/carnithine racemase
MAELIIKKENGIGWVCFSNLPKLNAMTYEMWVDFPKALQAFDVDPEVRVIVVTGDGEKSFVSGADISQFEKTRGTADAVSVYNAATAEAYLAPVRCSKPVIAKIRGICVGGGLGLAAMCDLRIAADDGVFRMPAARLGLGYGYGGLRRLADLIGQANTADIFFSARKFNAVDAFRMGFVNKLVPAAELDKAVTDYCTMIAENAPLTVATAKYTLANMSFQADKAVQDKVQAMVDACFASADYKEGRTAFMEKRTPNFQGK